MKISRELFGLVFRLHATQPWLDRYEEQLLALMNECEHIAEQQLLVALIEKFCYLDADKHNASVQSVCRKIAEDWRLVEAETQIVAATADSSPDSGQVVVYEVKNAMANFGWDAPFGVNRYDRAQRHINSRRNIVLVDEFIGSGRTMAGRIRTMRDQFKAKGVLDAKFYVAVYAGMEFSRDIINEEMCEDIFMANSLRKGISEMSLPDNVNTDLGVMSGIEDRLAANWNGLSLPRLGDAECEALYGRHIGNAPNSVFPVFWWPILLDGMGRRSIFTRR